ncbi:MAG: hypothetical protein AAFZ15_02265 [Bacteroidota bacterium]
MNTKIESSFPFFMDAPASKHKNKYFRPFSQFTKKDQISLIIIDHISG